MGKIEEEIKGSDDSLLLEGFNLRFRVSQEPGQDFLVVLPQQGRGALYAHGAFGKDGRRADHVHFSVMGVLDLLHQPQMLDLGIAEDPVESVDRPAGDAGLVEKGDPLVHGLLGQFPVDDLHEGRAVLDPAGIVRKPWVGL